MNRILLLPVALAFLFLSLSGCDTAEEEADIVDRQGTVLSLTGWYIIEADLPEGQGGRSEWFFPINLPREYQQDSLRVVFSANIQECYDGGDCIGTPVMLTRIFYR